MIKKNEVYVALAEMDAAIARAKSFPTNGSLGAAVKAVIDARVAVIHAVRACAGAHCIDVRDAYYISRTLCRDDSMATVEDAAHELYISMCS